MNKNILAIDTINRGIEMLTQHADIDADIDAWLLAEYVFDVNRQKYFLERDIKITEEEFDRYFELIQKRCQKIPLQHLTHVQEFMGFEFEVNEDVLIPRQDTELLVEKVIEYAETLDKNREINILDMCTGSGCIAISIAKILPNAKVAAVDLSGKALKVAKRNAEKLKADVRFINSNLFDNISGKYDILVSNPPYIESEVIPTLMPEVKDHEPLMALDGEKDGLAFYRKISENAKHFLNTGGTVFYEIGYNQGKSVPDILKKYNYKNIEVYKDLSGNDRVVAAGKGE